MLTDSQTDGQMDRWKTGLLYHTCLFKHVQQKLLALNSDALFVCVEVLRPSQPNGIMSNAVSLPNHTFTGQA